MKIYDKKNSEGGVAGMNKNIQRASRDERDEQIDVSAKNYAMHFMVTAAEILTVICIVKGNPAWKGSLSILFFGMGAGLVYKYFKYKEKPFFAVGIIFGLIGAALLIWFGITG